MYVCRLYLKYIYKNVEHVNRIRTVLYTGRLKINYVDDFLFIEKEFWCNFFSGAQ